MNAVYAGTCPETVSLAGNLSCIKKSSNPRLERIIRFYKVGMNYDKGNSWFRKSCEN